MQLYTEILRSHQSRKPKWIPMKLKNESSPALVHLSWQKMIQLLSYPIYPDMLFITYLVNIDDT